MHAVFMLYGIKSWVDHALMDMQAQKFLIPFRKGNETKEIWLQGSLRSLPFGVYEYVFPKESADLVFTTLNFHTKVYPQYIGIKMKVILSMLRKILYAKPIPEFKSDQKFLWIMDHVSVIPIGMREDGDFIEPDGWIHEEI